VCGGAETGLSVARFSPSRDRRVLDRDKNIAVGGCSSSFEREGYTFDVAASASYPPTMPGIGVAMAPTVTTCTTVTQMTTRMQSVSGLVTERISVSA
jgi:hypothetical protein